MPHYELREKISWLKRFVFIGFSAAFALAIILVHNALDVSDVSPGRSETHETYIKEEASYPEKLLDPVALFTLALVMSTVLLWRSTERLAALAARESRDTAESLRIAAVSADAARQQAAATQATIAHLETSSKAACNAAVVARDTLVAGNRAWLKTAIYCNTQPLFINEIGISTAVSFQIENVGTAPALRITFHCTIITLPANENPSNILRAYCEKVRGQTKMGGVSLFPSEIYPDVRKGEQAIQHGIVCSREDCIRNCFVAESGENIVYPYIIGCVEYSFPIDMEQRHQTSFIYELVLARFELFKIDEFKAIPPSMFALRLPSNFADGRHAD